MVLLCLRRKLSPFISRIPDALVAAIRALVLDKSEGGRRAQAGIPLRQPFTRGLERKPKPEYEMVEIVPPI